MLGVFIPSGGSKWVIEAPYVLQAANLHQVHLGWVVQIYNASEALPNLVNPFWMLPLLGILRLKARDLVGYGVLQLMVHIPDRVFPVLVLRAYVAVSAADEIENRRDSYRGNGDQQESDNYIDTLSIVGLT